MPRAFFFDEVRRINQDQQRALPDALNSPVRVGKLYAMRRVVVVHDADGSPVGIKREAVYTVRAGERVPQCMTVLAVDRVDLLLDEDTEDFLAPTIGMAKGCGYKTIAGLRDSWMGRHPRSPLINVVWFALGDVRDRPIFLNVTGQAGGDYTRSPSRALDEAEALTQTQMAALAHWNHQKDDARKAAVYRGISKDETLAQRMRRLETARERMGEEAYQAIRQNLRVIEQRLRRAEKRAS